MLPPGPPQGHCLKPPSPGKPGPWTLCHCICSTCYALLGLKREVLFCPAKNPASTHVTCSIHRRGSTSTSSMMSLQVYPFDIYVEAWKFSGGCPPPPISNGAPLKSFILSCHQMTVTKFCGIILCSHFSEKNYHGKQSKLGIWGGCTPCNICFLLLIQKYWCYALETSCVCYNCHFLCKKTQSKLLLGHVAKIWKSAVFFFQRKSVKSAFL